jgi:hypothetical protein
MRNLIELDINKTFHALNARVPATAMVERKVKLYSHLCKKINSLAQSRKSHLLLKIILKVLSCQLP